MADSAGIRAGKAFIELSAQDKFSKVFDSASKKLKGFGQSITDMVKWTAGISAAITAPLIVAAKASADSGAALYDMSRRTGLSVEALSTLSYAADRTSTDINSVEGAIKRMQKSIGGMADDLEGTTGKLDLLGLSAADLVGLAPEEQFGKVAKAIAAIKDPTAKAAAAISVFGRAGTDLIPLIDDFETLQARAKSLGFIRSTQSVVEAKALSDALYDAGRAAKGISGALASGVIPVLRKKTETMMKATLFVRDFIKSNKELVVLAFQVATAIGATAAAVAIVGQAIKFAAPAVSLIGSALGLLLNPIVLVSAALIGLVGYFVYASGAGAKLLQWLGDKFEILKSTAIEAIGGISDALAAKNMRLAAEILWTALKVAWIQGTQQLQNKWIDFKAGFVRVAAAAFYGALELWTNAKAGLLSSWEGMTTFLGNLWDGFVGTFVDAWNSGYLLVVKGINHLKDVWDEIFGDGTFDAGKANAAAEAAFDRKIQERRKREMDALAKREADKTANQAAIEQQRRDAVSAINGRESEISQAAGENAKQEIADLEIRRGELERQLTALRGKAKEEKAKKASDAPDLANWKRGQEAANLGATAASIKSQGLFNVAAFQSLKSSPSQDALRKAAEETAKATRDTAKYTKAMANNRSTFS